MELLYLMRSKAALAIVAGACLIFGVTALAWPVLGIVLFAGALALFAIASALFAVYELAVATSQAATGGRARPTEAPPVPTVRVTLTREAQEEQAARDRAIR